MTYIKCYVCKGNGQIRNDISFNEFEYEVCNHCNGQKRLNYESLSKGEKDYHIKYLSESEYVEFITDMIKSKIKPKVFK